MRNIVVIFLLALLLLSAGFAAKPESDLTKKQEASYFAINGGKAIHIPDQLDTIVKKRVEWMHELGLLWDRSDLWWHIAEPTPGNFDFTVIEKIVKFYEEQGIQIYPILCYGAKWWSGRTAPLNDAEIDEYGKYVYKIVDRFKNNFTYWSIWNEPNLATFWNPNPDAEMYTKLLKTAYELAKKADPNCKISAPVVAPLGAWDRKFVERIYQLGGKNYFDVFDYHYYRNSPPELEVPNEIDDIKALMRRYGDEKPMWISETGVSSPILEKPKSYERQAAYIVRSHLLCLAEGIQKIFYFDLQNWHDNPNESWDSYLGLVEAGDAKKQSFYAYKNMVSEVDFKRIIGRYKGFGEGIESVLIYDESKKDFSLAIWTSKEEQRENVNVACELRDIEIKDLYGKSASVLMPSDLPKDAKIRDIVVEVDNAPKYIHFIDKDTYLIPTGVKPELNKIEITPGDKQKLGIKIDPLLAGYNVSVEQAICSPGIKWDKDSKTIEADANAKVGKNIIKFVFNISYSNDAEEKSMSVVVNKKISRDVEVNVIPVFALSLRPFMENDKLKIDSVINNYSTKITKSDLSIKESGKEKETSIASKKDVSVKPGEALHVELDIDKAIIKKYKKSVKWELEYNANKSMPFRIYPAKLIAAPPKIDGQLDDWKDCSVVELNEKSMLTRGAEGWNAQEASAQAMLSFTKDAVFFAAKITDDDPMVNDQKAPNFWKGDAMELYLGFAGPSKRTVIDKKVEFQIGIIPTYNEKKPIVFLYHFDKIMENAKVVAEKTKDGYILEASIPLKDLGDPKIEEGALIGFDLALDDFDENDWAPQDVTPGRALMWGGKDMNWIDPSGWSMAIITK